MAGELESRRTSALPTCRQRPTRLASSICQKKEQLAVRRGRTRAEPASDRARRHELRPTDESDFVVTRGTTTPSARALIHPGDRGRDRGRPAEGVREGLPEAGGTARSLPPRRRPTERPRPSRHRQHRSPKRRTSRPDGEAEAEVGTGSTGRAAPEPDAGARARPLAGATPGGSLLGRAADRGEANDGGTSPATLVKAARRTGAPM